MKRSAKCWRNLLAAFSLLLGFALSAAPAVELWIKALDQQGKVLDGIQFIFGGVETLPTAQGVTQLNLPSLAAGDSIKLDLPRSLSEQWFLIDSTVHAPSKATEGPAEVVLMLREDLRKLARATQEAVSKASGFREEVSEAQKHQILLEFAQEHGLSEEALRRAIESFARTDDARDRGIAAYLRGEYAAAEAILVEVESSVEQEYLGTLLLLGESRYAQGAYSRATGPFRKALSIYPDHRLFLNRLGLSLLESAAWEEAERVLRRSLRLAEEQDGQLHPSTATAMSNLAALFRATNRLSESELLIRRALEVDEASFGPDHPRVAADLGILGGLLQETNRFMEAEPLIRHALAIDEASYGAKHPNFARGMNNLGQLLHATNRMSEAEPLMRKVLEIYEASHGSDNPKVAGALNNLAQLLQDLNRLSEAEPLKRRALEIYLTSYGPHHPDVAMALNNLGQLLSTTRRFEEAEPVFRQALAINEANFGPSHPNVAKNLNNLAVLLMATGRLEEAEQLLRRAHEIAEEAFVEGHWWREAIKRSYEALLSELAVKKLSGPD